MGDSNKYGNAVDFDVDLHSVYAAYLYVLSSQLCAVQVCIVA